MTAEDILHTFQDVQFLLVQLPEQRLLPKIKRPPGLVIVAPLWKHQPAALPFIAARRSVRKSFNFITCP